MTVSKYLGIETLGTRKIFIYSPRKCFIGNTFRLPLTTFATFYSLEILQNLLWPTLQL